MKVLVIGNGAREHALCWKLRQSPLLADLYCAPGNPGIAALADRVPLAAEEVHRLADFATEMRIDLTVVGPELPLTLGIADEFTSRGLADLRSHPARRRDRGEQGLLQAVHGPAQASRRRPSRSSTTPRRRSPRPGASASPWCSRRTASPPARGC